MTGSLSQAPAGNTTVFDGNSHCKEKQDWGSL